MFTAQTLRRLWPHAGAALVDGSAATAAAVFAKYGLTTTTAVAQAMAQFSHECGAGLEMVENLNYSAEGLRRTWPKHFNAANAAWYAHRPDRIANYVYEPPIHTDLGNRAGTTDGWDYRGRGGSQVTGRDGYAKLGLKTGLDLLAHPDLVNDPAHFLECAVADFVLCGCLPYALRDDTRMVTRRLNGGEIGLAQRTAWLARWKRALAADPAEVAPAPSLGRDEVLALQRQLRDLGYAEVGTPDGIWGSRTAGAVSAFQYHEHLPVTGQLDDATREALDGAIARPVSPDRANATADDLAAAGSDTVAAAQSAHTVGGVKAAIGAVLAGGGIGEQTGAIDGILGTAQQTVDKVTQAKGLLAQLHDLAAPALAYPLAIPIGLALIVAGVLVCRYASQVIARRVEDHRSGVHAGTEE